MELVKFKRPILKLITIFVLFFSFTFGQDSSKTWLDIQQFWLDTYASNSGGLNKLPSSILNLDKIAKAQPDEDFYGIGHGNNNYNPFITSFGGTPKTNQAYVWGLAKTEKNIWWGTGPNVHCLVMGGYLQTTTANMNDCWVCEFGENSNYPNLPPSIRDWRPPRIFMYDSESETEYDKTWSVTPPYTQMLMTTVGIRSGGSHNGVVFMAGPALTGGINIFAFNGLTGQFIGAHNLNLLADGTQANNIRKWLVVDDVLYTAIGTTVDGKVLRWNGDLSSPFDFEIVGNLDTQGAELAFHDGRIFISTWPVGLGVGGAQSGLWMSPPIDADGLNGTDKDAWQKVWSVADYEPDMITALTYGGGALMSYNGELYWGTMHVPLMATVAHLTVFPPDDIFDILAAAFGTWRAVTIFKGKDFGEPTQEVSLLYGMPMLPAYDPIEGWQIVPNNMGGVMPQFGLAGFNNFFNNYTWTMENYNNRLYTGTMDHVFLIYKILVPTLNQFASMYLPEDSTRVTTIDQSLEEQIQLPAYDFGADLLRFDDSNSPAVQESVNGVENEMNYGIRTMLVDDALYLGMANPMNLHTDGGWELIKAVETANVTGNILYGETGYPAVTQVMLEPVPNYSKLFYYAQADQNGEYLFQNIPVGKYKVKLLLSDEDFSSAVNMRDAYIVQEMAAKIRTQPDYRTQLFKVCDVSNDGHIRWNDAVMIMDKIFGLLDVFTVPDWIYEDPGIIDVHSDTQFPTISAIISGDVDLSYIDMFDGRLNLLSIETTFLDKLTSNSVELPFYLDADESLGGLSLVFEIPNDNFIYKGINSELPLNVKEAEGKLYISGMWISESGNWNKSEPFFTINFVRSENSSQRNFGLNLIKNQSMVFNKNAELVKAVLKTIEFGRVIPRGYALNQNYPNPFNPSTTIKFDLPKNEFVSLKIYDILGREISTMLNQKIDAGNHEVTFDAKNLPSGIYFYTISAGEFKATKKMILLR